MRSVKKKHYLKTVKIPSHKNALFGWYDIKYFWDII